MDSYCKHCKSPINLVKAKRRYIRRWNISPNGGLIGLCACGTIIRDDDYYARAFKLDIDLT